VDNQRRSHYDDSVLGAHRDNSRRRGDLRGNPVRACHLPHLLRAHLRLWEAAAINCAGKDGGARARNSAHTEAGARPDPEEDVAADEGVSLHRRAPAHCREYRVRMAGSDRPESIHRGADGVLAPVAIASSDSRYRAQKVEEPAALTDYYCWESYQ
jgi:hypothetical protein